MSERLDNQKQSISSIQKLLQERIDKANPRRELTIEEAKRLAKLEAIAEKLRRGENVQNRQLQTLQWKTMETTNIIFIMLGSVVQVHLSLPIK